MTQRRAKKLFRKGFRGLKRGNFTGALELFQRARSLDPNVPAGYHNIAVAYMKLGDFNEAERHLLEALRLDSSYTFALISLANLRYLKGRIDEAWEFLSSAAEIYLEDGLPSNTKEVSYFLKAFADVAKEGRVPERAMKAVDDLLKVLVSEYSARGTPELMMLKLAINFREGLERWREQDLKRRMRMRSAPINPDATIEEVLSRYNKDALVGIGQILQLGGSLAALKKAEVVKKICVHLRDYEFVRGLVGCLKPEERLALWDLMLKNGIMSWVEFAEKHGGDMEESIYWNWHPPKTVMGRLKARGLITEGSFSGKDRIFIPRELRPTLLAIQRQEVA